ncbi:hypothetical protein [Neorhizobium sp. JUb45]|uniref:hypothetical protein n=1 Tax=unclassified Neorhizobium TaxID=2629175 RepID=UPI00104E3D38|nr:hypothetical protein [Neorhizobium sp. JUb45]
MLYQLSYKGNGEGSYHILIGCKEEIGAKAQEADLTTDNLAIPVHFRRTRRDDPAGGPANDTMTICFAENHQNALDRAAPQHYLWRI